MGKYVVIDLEMCKVPKQMRTKEYNLGSETIQIGAVLVDDSMQIVGEFNTYVAPKYGFVDEYIKSLTGITRADVRNACDMKSAINALLEWAPDDAVFVSWSNSDLLQIRKEVNAKHIEDKRLYKVFNSWIDCQITFSGKMNEYGKRYRLEEALVAADIYYDENMHDGLVDAKNTAKLFIKMQKEPELTLNKYYKYAKTGIKDECEEHTTLGDMFPWLSTICVPA